MAVAQRRNPIFMLSDRVDMVDLTDEPGDGWTKIEPSSKRAYGCGEHGQEAVKGLMLYVRLGEDRLLTSSLAIRMTDEALRRFDSELEPGCPHKRVEVDTLCYHETKASGIVQTAEEQGLTVILLVFRRDFHRNLTYYLVYNHIDASLSMIEYIPELYEADPKLKAVPKRCGSDFELFLMARARLSSTAPQEVLCVCTPETRANPASGGPWQIKERRCFQLEELQEPFSPDVAFSLQDKGFWADLSQGIMFCDLHTSTVVDFGFIGLPPDPNCHERRARLQLAEMDEDEPTMMGEMMDEVMDELMLMDEPKKLTRTLGCVRDTIWFVCIDRARNYADTLVKMWTLEVPQDDFQKGSWKKVKEVRSCNLWASENFKVEGLPKGLFQYPVLTPDGLLCLVLADPDKFPRPHRMPVVDKICIFNMNSKRIRLKWHGIIHDLPFTHPIIFPSNFIQGKHGSRKTNVDENHPAAGLAALAGTIG